MAETVTIDFRRIKLPKTLFITGIDTDAGKSYATGWLARLMMDAGLDVITQKFIQTGNRDDSEDIILHRQIMDIPFQPADKDHLTAPIILSYPASADLAARIDGIEIDTEIITKATSELHKQYDYVLIEGAGGLMVPIKREFLTIDYIAQHNLPVVLVTNGKLGSINHTLLSLNAIRDAGLSLFAVIYNRYFDKDEIIAADTRKYLSNWIKNHFPGSYYIEMPR